MNPTMQPGIPAAEQHDFSCPDQTMSLIRDLEQELARLQSIRPDSPAELDALRARWAELDARERSVGEGFAVLEDRERWLAARIGEVERYASDLVARESSLTQHRHELDLRMRQLASASDSDTGSRIRIATLERELEATRVAAASERRSVEARLEAMQTELDEVQQTRRELEERLAKQNKSAQSRQSSLEQRLQATEQSLTTAESSLKAAKARMNELEQSSARSSADAEAAAALKSRIAALEQELGSEKASAATLRTELDSGRAALKKFEAAGADAATLRTRLESAETAQRSAEGKAKAAAGELAGVRSRLDKAESEAASLRRELSEAKSLVEREGRKSASLQRELDGQSASRSGEADLQNRIAALETQIESSRKRAVKLEEELAQSRQATQKLDGERKALAAEVERLQSGDGESKVDPAEAEALEARVRELVSAVGERDARIEVLASDLEKLRQAADGKASATEADADQARRLQDKVRQLGQYAAMLRQRRDRLRRVRQALAGRRAQLRREQEATSSVAPASTPATRGGSQAALHELRQVQAKREELRQVQKFLAESEVRMVRRWANRRGSNLAMTIVLFIVAACGAAWFSSDLVWPTPGVASVDLVARGGKGQPLDPRLADGWKEWHQAILSDPIFVDEVAKRLAARGYQPSDAATVGAMLSRDLKVDSDGPGRMRLVMEGADRRTVPIVLDTVATTLASQSAAQSTRRADQTPAVVIGERARDGKTVYSLLDPAPIDAERLTRVGVIAGGLVALAGLIAIPTVLVLRRTKGLMASEELPSIA